MTLVYRSVFRDTDGSIVERADECFEAWLGGKNFELPEGGLPEGGLALSSTGDVVAWLNKSRHVTDEGIGVTRFRLVEETSDARWVTSAVWVGPDNSDATSDDPRWMWIDLEHEPLGERRVVRPGSPRLVRELLAIGEASDGPVPLTEAPWRVTSTQVAEMVSYVMAPDRQIPVVVFAADAKRAYDQDRLARLLARDLAGVAIIFQLADVAATDRFAKALPEGYEVFGGAMRTYLAGVGGRQDSPSLHRVLGRASLAALGQRAFPAVKDQILEISTRRAAPVVPGARPVRKPDTASKSAEARAEVRRPGTEWIRRRLERMRRRLGLAVPSGEDSSETLTDEFDSALTQLLDRVYEGDTPTATVITDDTALADHEQSLEQQQELYDSLLQEADREREDLQASLGSLRFELDDLQIEATESSATVEQAERRIRWLERRIRELGDPAVGVDASLPEAPVSVAEVLELARTHLHHVVLGDTDQSAAELDLHAGSQMFAIKTWQALIALDAYAQARANGAFQNSFIAWCQAPPPGSAAISANAVASGESQTVDTNPDLWKTRVFRVPKQVNPSGEVYMPAHLRISKRTQPAPRLHFHDDAAGSGRVYVGYIGAHLPTARFS